MKTKEKNKMSAKGVAETAVLAYIATQVFRGFAAMARDTFEFRKVRKANRQA